ncbi:hypothetical protein ACFQ3S_05960 [Mucilaginibacter terrae]|uniref:hypothetical protein n=1 Tax=Mucilaginibacter terrae TaxID=1955052 RepID=UPI00362DBBDC
MKYIALSLVSATLLLSSCSKRYYAPALFRSDVVYIPKPASYDSIKHVIYVSGGISGSQGINLSDEVFTATIDLSAGHVFSNANVAYGAFAAAGNISNPASNDNNNYPLDSKGFTAIGGRFSANLFSNKNRTDFRYLGFEAVYSKEFGSYTNFRKAVNGLANNYSITGTDLLSMGLTSEIIWRNKRTRYTQYGIRLFIGGRFINNTFENLDDESHKYYPAQINLGYFMKYQRYICSINTNLLTSFGIKLGYSF